MTGTAGAPRLDPARCAAAGCDRPQNPAAARLGRPYCCGWCAPDRRPEDWYYNLAHTLWCRERTAAAAAARTRA